MNRLFIDLSIFKSKPRFSQQLCGTLSIIFIAFLFSACEFLNVKEDPKEDQKPVVTVAGSTCSEITDPIAKAKADSLVQLANSISIQDFKLMEKSESWEEAKAAAPTEALTYYNQALSIAPGHCQALFGKTIVSASMAVQDDELDVVMKKMNNMNNNEEVGTPLYSNNNAYFVTTEDAPALLLKTKESIEDMDPLTYIDIRDAIEGSLLPHIDSVIANLDSILQHEDFVFEYENEGEIVQLDKSEISPMLGAMKIFRSLIIVIISRDFKVDLNGEYAWADTLSWIKSHEFDHLRPGQKAALDHFTSFFKTSSKFTSFRMQYKAEYENIPNKLLEAVQDIQDGFAYGIKEYEEGLDQSHDPIKIGKGEGSDLDPDKLQEISDNLELVKKYLKGEVNLTYAKGTQSLKVNFPKAFTTKNIQAFFPYHAFRPYSEWNDIIDPEIYWDTYTSDQVIQELDQKLNIPSNARLRSGYLYNGQFTVEVEPQTKFFEMDWGWYDNYAGQFEFTQINNSCQFNYTYTNNPYSSDDIFITNTSGSIILENCKVEGNETFFKEIQGQPVAPFIFTDAAGHITFDPTADHFNELNELTGKIIFPDPTFNGVFPELTNNNIWDKLFSLSKVEHRVEENCSETQESDGYNNIYYYWNCDPILPSNPSDLDRIVYYLKQLDAN